MSEALQEVQTEITELESWDDIPSEDSGDVNEEITEEASAESEAAQSEHEVESFEEIASASEESSEPSEELPSEEGSETVQASSEEEGTGTEDREAGEPEPQIFKVKVDGEEQDVSLEDLKSNYSGKVVYDKKFNELNLERKQHEAEINEINNYINHFAGLMKEGNAIEAMSYFAEFGGMAPHQFKQQLIKSILPEIERYQGMDPQEIDLEYKTEEAEYYRKQMESDRQLSAQQQAQAELSAKENGLREAHHFTSEEWDQASAYVREHLQDKDAYSPELVRDFMVNEKAENAVEAVDASLLDNSVFMAAFEKLVYETPEANHQDLVDHLKSLYEEKVEEPKKEEVKKELTKKVEKSQPAKQVSSKQTNVFEPEKDEYGNEIEDWEDLDFF